MSFQKIMQKYFINATIITMACLIVYSLGFYTPLAPLQYIEDYVDGISIFFDEDGIVQTFNRQLLLLSICGIFICILFYLFNTTKRKIYYLSNYLISAAYCSLCVYIFIFMMKYIPIFRDMFINIPTEQCQSNLLCTRMKTNYWFPSSTFIFDLGIALSTIILFSGIFIAFNAVAKFFINKKEIKIRKELKARLEVQ
jgi:cbb3-type cytochrome oxidase subunit 3